MYLYKTDTPFKSLIFLILCLSVLVVKNNKVN